MPLYQKMLETFTEKYWLADQDTCGYYYVFLEFVEVWRHLAGGLLPECSAN